MTEGQVVNRGELLVGLDLTGNRYSCQTRRSIGSGLWLDKRVSRAIEGASRDILIEGQLLNRLNQNNKILDVLDAEQKHLSAKNGYIKWYNHAILEQRINQLNNEIMGLEIQRSAEITIEILKTSLLVYVNRCMKKVISSQRF